MTILSTGVRYAHQIVTNGAFDSMDGYQWALTAAAHDQRHVGRILEVKGDPRRSRLSAPQSRLARTPSLAPSTRGEALDPVTGSFDILEQKGEPCFPNIPEGSIPSTLERLNFRLKNADPRIGGEESVVFPEKLRLVLDRNRVVAVLGPNVPIHIAYRKGNHVCDLFRVVGTDGTQKPRVKRADAGTPAAIAANAAKIAATNTAFLISKARSSELKNARILYRPAARFTTYRRLYLALFSLRFLLNFCLI
jgi:hypothetical protein